MSNELTTGALALNPADGAQALCDYIHARKGELMGAIARVEVTAENWNSESVKDALETLKDAVEDLREKGKALVAEVCAQTDMQRVLSQIDSRLWSFKAKADPLCAYSVLSNAYKELKAKVDEFKAANTPPEPTHTYVIKLTATDKALGNIAKAAKKEGAADLCWASAQSDKAVKQIAKWFEENA
jgi:hypothetical protein